MVRTVEDMVKCLARDKYPDYYITKIIDVTFPMGLIMVRAEMKNRITAEAVDVQLAYSFDLWEKSRYSME